jgi:hypothetical protein
VALSASRFSPAGEAPARPLSQSDPALAVIVADVHAAYSTRKKGWSDRIVTTAVTGSMNEASVTAAAAAGVTKKQWLAAHDTRTRPTHRAADGLIVGMDDAFHVGAADLEYPGDPSGPAAEVINCRCTLLFPMPELGQPVYQAPDAVPAGSGGVPVPS